MTNKDKTNALISKTFITGQIQLVTGLHIGAGKENVEIGGIDLPIVRQKLGKREPYIPGSSLRGKIRCLLEQVAGANDVGGDSEVNNLFGITEEKKSNRKQVRTRLFVRDAKLCNDSITQLEENNEFLDMPFTEAKWENTIRRLEGTAENPRQIERVPAGSIFDFEMILNEYDDDIDNNLNIELLKNGLCLLERDYLGGNGSRGYGAIKFQNLHKTVMSIRKGVFIPSESEEWNIYNKVEA